MINSLCNVHWSHYFVCRKLILQPILDCGCDIGGSVDGTCNKATGQCTCHPRIMGRTCNEPIELHYFPTLYHLQYEAEDGLTPEGNTVRYRWDENEFANFSWKGYAFFTIPQVCSFEFGPMNCLYCDYQDTHTNIIKISERNQLHCENREAIIIPYGSPLHESWV